MLTKLLVLALAASAVLAVEPAPKRGVKEDCPKFVCPAPTGSYADPCTCRRFYNCQGSTAHKRFCPTGLFWDDIRKQCDYKDAAVCGPVDFDPLAEAKKEAEEIGKADPCDAAECALPYCYCSRKGTEPPVSEEKVPQFVMVMIDGAVNTNNYKHYVDLLNGTSVGNDDKHIKATFFIHHEYCNYQMVQKLYADGNEIALGSVTGKNIQLANTTVWTNELVSLKNILKKYANIADEDILGMRAPKLKPGYNRQYDAMLEAGLIWDASVSTDPLDVPVWPYTLDYSIPHDCRVDSCPSKSFPGLWEIPVNSHHVAELGSGFCDFLDQCIFTYQSKEDVFEWLKEDFKRYYEGNRAPYLISLHTNWFLGEHQIKGLKMFVDWTLEKNDVFYITGTELLLWMTDPDLDKSSANRYRPVAPPAGRPVACQTPTSCELAHTDDDGISTLRYMSTCEICPSKYPWLEGQEER